MYLNLFTAVILASFSAQGVSARAEDIGSPEARDGPGTYLLGPEDQLVINAIGVDEFASRGDKPAQIDMRGYIEVPLIGHVKAAGLTVQQLESELKEQLSRYVKSPAVSVTVAEYKSQPVSIVGSVNQPGVYRLGGNNTLIQIVSQARGLTEDAGNEIRITRQKIRGPIPLPRCALDPSGAFYTAGVDAKSLFNARDPLMNISLEPNDVITVPRAEMVYVVGAVNRAGAFVLNQRSSISALQALSRAEGLGTYSAASSSKIIRRREGQPVEVQVDLKKILAGQSPDVPLYANDILFIPTSTAKRAGSKTVEAIIQIATGVAIYHRF